MEAAVAAIRAGHGEIHSCDLSLPEFLPHSVFHLILGVFL